MHNDSHIVLDAHQPIPKDAKHPAAGQYGLFAAANLFPGEHVIDYLGDVQHPSDQPSGAQRAK